MSKSLKNFITIREALREFTARQLRLLFCLSAWSQPITFNQQSRGEMVQKEATLKNFFLSVQVPSPPPSQGPCRPLAVACFLRLLCCFVPMLQ